MSDTKRKQALQLKLDEAHDLAWEALAELSRAKVFIPKDHPLRKLVQLLGDDEDKARTTMIEAAEMRLDGKTWREVEDALKIDTSHYRNAQKMGPAFEEALETLGYFREAHQEVYEKRKWPEGGG